jgi:serine/threonine protein kinase
MPPPQTADSGQHYRPFTKEAGSEPLPGYKLIEPLGRGGFGEVWKCEAPGGLHKGIKFVPGAKAEDGQGERRLNQELDAFQQIKAIRHPFLLTLERVELIDGELVMVMELADRQLQDRFRECRACGLPGIPRDELLAYFADAAEALDMISAKYGLQHLDVKPANLFLVAGHVKVGDYGLVASLDPDDSGRSNRGLTPKYVAPEALKGQPSHRSDQYSLALVYQELLTGTFPYTGKSAQQIMLQHAAAVPDVSPLPPGDRPIVLQALAKDPAQRFPSCLAFVQGLMSVAAAGAAMDVRRARVERSRAEIELPLGEIIETEASVDPVGGKGSAEATHNSTLPSAPPSTTTTPAKPTGPMPKLISANDRRPPASSGPAETPPPKPAAHPFAEPQGTPGPRGAYTAILNPVRSVVSVSRLAGGEREEHLYPADEVVRLVLEHAAAGAHVPQIAGDLGRLPDGTWLCRFPSTIPASVVPIKLAALGEHWGVSVEQPEPTRLVVRHTVGAGGFWKALSKKKGSGYEVTIQLPTTNRAVGEVTVTGSLFGNPPRDVIAQAQDVVPKIIAEIRSELKNVEDRRKHPRIPANFPVAVYAIHSDGGIDPPVLGFCRDVSAGGLCVVLKSPPATKYFYAAFDGIAETANHAILARTVRVQTTTTECACGAIFRTDL